MDVKLRIGYLPPESGRQTNLSAREPTISRRIPTGDQKHLTKPSRLNEVAAVKFTHLLAAYPLVNTAGVTNSAPTHWS